MSKGQEYVDANPLNIPVKEFSDSKDRIPAFVYLRLSPSQIANLDKGGTGTSVGKKRQLCASLKTRCHEISI